MAGPDIAPLHSITSLPPYTPAGSVASAYTPSGGDANACMNDTGVPLSAATTGGANRMMSANAVGKAPTTTVASTFTATAQGGASIPLRTTQPTIVMKFRYQTGRENPPRGTGTPIQLLSTSRLIRIATQERLWCVLVPNPPTTPATAKKRILSDGRPAGCVTQGETPLPSRPPRNSLCMGCDKGRAA